MRWMNASKSGANGLAANVLPALTIIALAALSGCAGSRIKQTQGYIVDETLVASVQPGVDNRASVEKTLGRPSWASEFDTGEWYYVTRNSEQVAFLAPKPTSQSIIIISFDPTGAVTKVAREGLEKVASVKMNGDSTPTLGRDSSLLQDLFGNIGQVSGGGGPGGNTGGTGRDGPK